jgi:NAD+--asparagine ADP-ribosyltransferase
MLHPRLLKEVGDMSLSLRKSSDENRKNIKIC